MLYLRRTASVLLLLAGLFARPGPAAADLLESPEAVRRSVAEVVTDYRKMIVLLEAEPTLAPGAREQAGAVGRHLYHHNQDRLRLLLSRVEAESQGDAGLPLVHAFLDELERGADLRDADKLAFRDFVEDLLAVFADASGSEGLRQRLGEDLEALAAIQSLYQKEMEAVVSRLGKRGMQVRREAWEQYVAFLRSRFDPVKILAEHPEALEELPRTRGANAPEAVPDVLGKALPPMTLALTFDDGPHFRNTPAIQEILRKEGVSAVFFEVGQNIGTAQKDRLKLTRAAEAARGLVEAGLPVANHSLTHPVMTRLGPDDLANEISVTNRLIREIAKKEPDLFRPPYGAADDAVLGAARSHNLRTLLWDVDSKDWADPVPASIATRVIAGAEEQGRGVILFHDIQRRTVETLPQVIAELKAKGYRFAAWTSDGFAATGAAAEATRPADKPQAPTLYRESWAVVVGIDDYSAWPKLRYAVNDASSMKDLLIRRYRFQPENVIFLPNREATRQNILAALTDRLGDPARISREDRVLVFFAGHGTTRKLASGRELGYLVPFDADREHPSGWLSMNQLQEAAEAIPAKHVFFLMDSCYSGLGLTRGGKGAQNYLADFSRRVVRQMFTAGGADQEVADNGPGGHSVFTWTLLQALEGKGDLNRDGYITASEVASYVGPIVSSLSRQTPAFGNLPGSEGGEFLFELDHESEFLNELSAQLEDEGIRLNTEIDRIRAEIAGKAKRNRELKGELAAAKTQLATLEKPGKDGRPKGETALSRNDEGMALYQAKRYPEALEAFLAATRLDPTNALAANNAGFALFKLERYQEAAAWFEKTLALDPKRGVAYRNLGDAYERLGKPEAAVAAFQKYLELNPEGKAAAWAQERIAALQTEEP